MEYPPMTDLLYDYVDLNQMALPFLDTTSQQTLPSSLFNLDSTLTLPFSPLSADFSCLSSTGGASPTSTDSFQSYLSPPTDSDLLFDPSAGATSDFDQILKSFGLDYKHQPTCSSLPLLDQEPLIVNAKQYHRIMKRRATRAIQAAALRNGVDADGKAYKHESRHKHAVRRPRGPGGRFLTAEEIKAMGMVN